MFMGEIEAWDEKLNEITITETRKKWNAKKNLKQVQIYVKSVRMGARCLWRVEFERKKSFEVGKEEWWGDGWMIRVVMMTLVRWDGRGEEMNQEEAVQGVGGWRREWGSWFQRCSEENDW